MVPDKFKNYYLGRNTLFYSDYEFVIKLSFPRVFVRYKITEGYYTDFNKFFNNIAEVQYLEGERPSETVQQQILDEIWNYITMDKGFNQDEYINS